MSRNRRGGGLDRVIRSDFCLQTCVCSRSRARSRWPRSAIFAVATFLALGIFAPAFAQQKPLQIGALALGPRFVPAWRCGEADYRPGSAPPQHETIPIYILGLLDELQKLKYVEDRPENAGKPGRRFVLNLRTGTSQQLRTFAREFVAQGVDVIVAIATASTRIAQEETRGSSIPILMAAVSQPVGEGFVQSLARPGGLITGVSHQLLQGSGKRVELFREVLPGLQRVLMFREPGYSVSEKSMVEIRSVADRLKIELIDWTVTNRAEVQEKLTKIGPETADGIMMTPDSLVISNLDLILETSLAQRIPTFGLMDYMAEWGTLMSYGPSAVHAGAQVARYLDKISNGAKPGDMPIDASDPVFVVNLKAAKCLGVSVPFEVLRQADRVIR